MHRAHNKKMLIRQITNFKMNVGSETWKFASPATIHIHFNVNAFHSI